MRIIVTAGFDRAPNVLALCELLQRRGHTVAGVLVVSTLNPRRLRLLLRQRGLGFLSSATRRLLGIGRQTTNGDSPVLALLSDHEVVHRSLRAWCSDRGVDRLIARNLNGEEAVEFIRSHKPDVVIYGGGGILRTEFLEAAGRRVLNAHSGPLPEVRGMNACEWSLLLGYAPAVTIHYINEGIDTGDILRTVPVPVEPGDNIDRMRDKCVAVGIVTLLEVVASFDEMQPKRVDDADGHRQCYVMAPVMREILEARLAGATRCRFVHPGGQTT